MALLKLVGGVNINIPAINDKECQFVSLETSESILGELPTATLKLRCDRDILNLLDSVTIKIDNSSGYSIVSNMYVYQISYLSNLYTVNLMVGTPDFTRKNFTGKFTNIKNAVNSLRYAELVTNSDTDLLNDIPIYQMSSTNYQLLTKLLKAWKKNTIFGYALDSIRINDLSNYQKKWEDFSMRINLTEIDAPALTEPKKYSQTTKFVEYSDGVDPNHSYVMFDSSYQPIDNEYRDLFANYLYNTKFATTKNVYNTSIRELVPVNITDGTEVGNKMTSIFKIFISARKMYFDMNTVKVDYTFRSIEPL